MRFRRKHVIAVLTTAAIIIGVAGGTGGFTFVYARGSSYLTDDPAACANCHIMQDNFDAWAKSSHHAVAACNDCHAPHDGLVRKLWVKGRNGFNHSLAFTTGRFDDPLRITEANLRVTEAACRHCHQDLVHMIDPGPPAEATQCTRCHHDVGH